MFDSTNEHLADAAAGSLPAAAMMIDQENITATATGRYDDSEPALDPAYIQTLQLLAEKKVKEAEEKAKMDEEAEWFAAAAEQSSDDQVAASESEIIGGSSYNIITSSTAKDTDIAPEDILQSIEESVDYNNQTSGFVTSFALPLSPIVPDSSEDIDAEKEEVDNNSDHANVRESLSTHPYDEQQQISQQQRATSPATASIFRTASSSSSTSQRNRGMISPSSPYYNDDSMGSDSTEVADNASHSYTIPTKKQPQHLPPLDHVDKSDNVIEGEVVSPLASPMITSMKKSIQKSKPNAKGIKSNNEQVTTARRTKRKNNLVISPLPVKSKDLEIIEATTTDGNSKTTVSNNKPPTHPSIKPSSSLSSQPITRTQSDADTSVDLSEATPITTHAKSSWFQGYSSEEDDEGDGVVRRSESKNLSPSVGNTYDDKRMDEGTTDAAHRQSQKVSQPPIGLEGLEIFDFNALPPNDGITPKHNNLSTNNNTNGTNKIIDNEASKGNNPLNDSLNSSTEYTVSSLFNPKSNRQYQDENLFFNGIYESGLQSSSFEQVENTAEDRMCTDAEIELVFNSSGVEQPSFLLNDDTDISFASSSVVADDLDECASVEERREVVRRIQQWRRGRARENSIDANADRADECETEQDKNVFNFDYDDDAIEMAPLTAAKIDDSVSIDCNNSNGNERSSIYSTNNLSWNNTFFGNLLQQIQPSQDEYNRRGRNPRYDDIDFDRNTDKFFSCFSRWKKLMIVCTIFLLFGSLISGDGLEKHHRSDSYSGYRENDPLAKSNFIEHGRIPDDTDDYDGLLSYHSSGMPTPLGNDYDNIYSYQQPAKSDILVDDVWLHFEMEDDEFDTPMIGDLEWPDQNDESSNFPKSYTTQSHLVSSKLYNQLVGIDTIVVLGDHHSGLDWLVTKLNQLYPDLIIRNGFQGEDKRNGRALNESTSHLRRKTKVVDPLSNEVIHHLGGADAFGEENGKPDTEHILVIALFLNPYDWLALMHSSSKMHEKSWRDYLTTKWESYANLLEYRANMINSAVIKSMERDDVKLVMPLKYEKLLEPFENFDNYILSPGNQEVLELPGIVGMIDDIQSHTGLRADESVGWEEPRDHNPFWADDIGCTGHICHPKIQKLREDVEYITFINEHLDWKAEGLIGYHQMMTPKPAIDQIVVLGERHSGADWLVDRLSRCFPDVNVKYGFDSRPGKFFQTEPTHAQPATLVISIFLNPFDWVDMMRSDPINAPAHKNLEWTDFVTRRWERRRSNMDENLDDTVVAVCSFGFSYNEIIPCMTQRDPNTDSFPLYELRTDGTSYANLLELREDKIKNFLSTANFAAVVDHIPIRYEDLVWDDDYTDDASYLTLPFPGIAGLLEKIRDQTKLIPDINAGWILDEDGIFRAEKLGVGVSGLDPYFVQWMEDNVDWDVEDLVGYFP